MPLGAAKQKCCITEMALALLKRSDADLVLPVACDAPDALAAELSTLHPFTVDVVAVWPTVAGKLHFVQQVLWPTHAGNGWFRAAVPDATQLINNVCQRQADTGPTLLREATAVESPEVIAKCIKFAHAVGNDAPNSATDSFVKACEGKPRLTVDPSWHALLQECPRANADKATKIRKGLKQALGPIEAAAVLGQYKECALRVSTGGCQRFIVNENGVTMKLADCNVAPTL